MSDADRSDDERVERLVLDEAMRARLRALRDDATPLDAQARERVVAAAVSAGRARSRTWRWAAAGVAAAAMLAAAVTFPWQASRPDPTPPPSAALACEAWDHVPSSAVSAGTLTSLGARGTLGLSIGGEAAVEASGPCATEIVLSRGTVAVQADDLGGGELSVRAGEVRVRVTGTRFSVGREPSSEAVHVAVVEGTVTVTRAGEPATAVTAGGWWRWSAEAASTGPLDPPRAATLEALLSPASSDDDEALWAPAPPDVPDEGAVDEDEPALDPGALALAAEAHYRRGELAEARAAFRRAGRSSESVCLRWARLELEAGALDAAGDALALHARRHARGRMAAEAAYLELELLEARGDRAGARRVAERIVAEHPGTAQALAAARRL